MMKKQFSHLIDTVTAERDAFISESHIPAVSVAGDNVESVKIKLTKGNEPPPAAKANENRSDDTSTLTGETRESKDKAYIDAATK